MVLFTHNIQIGHELCVFTHQEKLMLSMFIKKKTTEKRTKEQTSTFHRHNKVILRTDIIAFASWGFFVKLQRAQNLKKEGFIREAQADLTSGQVVSDLRTS